MTTSKIDLRFASWATSPKAKESWINQDAHLSLKGNAGIAAVVLDGIGGAGPDGGKASTMVLRTLFYNLYMTDFQKTPEELADRTSTILQLADGHLKGMTRKGLGVDAGTTVVLTIVKEPEPNCTVYDVVTLWAGDSRAYCLTPDNLLHPLTIDNAEGLYLQGFDAINEELSKTTQPFLSNLEDASELDTEEKRRVFLGRKILDSCLLADPIFPTPDFAVSLVKVPLRSKILLTTDGLANNLRDLEIQEILSGSKPLEGSKALVDAAEARSSTKHIRATLDDITAVELILNFANACPKVAGQP